MCCCKVNEHSVLRSFAVGADGVLVHGCLPEECPYMKSNLCVRQRVMALKPLLEAIGVGSERLRIEWISASEDMSLAERVKSFTQTLKQLGPSPFSREC